MDVTECQHRVILRANPEEPAPCPTCGGRPPNADLTWKCRECGQKWMSPIHPTVAAGGQLCGYVQQGPWPEWRSCRRAWHSGDDHDIDRTRYRYAPREPGAINGYVPDGEYEP